MTFRATACLILVLMTMALNGCGSSPPTEFITLDAAFPHHSVPVYAGPPVVVGRMTLPPELDRLSLVRRAQANRLNINGVVKWAAPLDLLVRHALAVDLADRLPPGAVIIPGEPQPQKHALLLVVVFNRFSADLSGEVKLQAVWTLMEATSGKVLLTRTSSVTASAASTGVGDIAAAISQALGKLSDVMATVIDKVNGPEKWGSKKQG